MNEIRCCVAAAAAAVAVYECRSQIYTHFEFDKERTLTQTQTRVRSRGEREQTIESAISLYSDTRTHTHMGHKKKIMNEKLMVKRISLRI